MRGGAASWPSLAAVAVCGGAGVPILSRVARGARGVGADSPVTCHWARARGRAPRDGEAKSKTLKTENLPKGAKSEFKNFYTGERITQ